MANFKITDTLTPFLKAAPGVIGGAAKRGAQQTGPKVLARMEANAPRFTGQMAAAIRANGSWIGIVDPEQAAVALYNEYSPNHQPFMRPAAQASVPDLIESVTNSVQAAEDDLKQ